MTKNVTDDLSLVDRARKKDPKAFERLLKKYHKSVYYMLLKMVNNPDDAQDLTQEAFAKAFNSIEKFDATYAFSTWLFRIATNNAIDFIRKKRVKTISMDNPWGENEDGDTMRIDPKDPEPNPGEEMLLAQRKQYLAKAIEKLPAKYKLLVEMRYFQELSYEEVAEKLELPLGTVKAQLFRARELLNEQLSHMEDQM